MRIFWAILVLMFGGANFAHAESVQFFEKLQDIPLMPGLVEQAGETVFYDKPDGRIVESVAALNGQSIESVRDYYQAALPQFGWVLKKDDRYTRGDESLELVFEEAANSQALRILVQPR